MKLYLILIVAILCLMPVIALEECKSIIPPSEIPCRVTSTWNYTAPCSNHNVSLYNTTGQIIQNYTLDSYGTSLLCNFTFNYSTTGSYTYRVTNGDSGNILVEAQDTMESLAVTIFVLLITVGIFTLPKWIKQFSGNKYIDHTLKNCCIVIGLFLLSLDTTMVVTMADNAGLGITQELFRYLWLINWAAYIAIVIVILSFVYHILTEWNEDKKKRSMGEDGI